MKIDEKKINIVFPMIYVQIISLVAIIAVSNAYQNFLVKNLCPHSDLKQAFNQLYNNRPGIQLFNGSESAANIYQIWTEDNLMEFQDCVFTIDSNLYLENGGRYGRGIFVSLKKLHFRQTPRGECIDYVRIRFDGAKTDKICGSFDANSEMGKGAFFNEGVGIVKVHIFVNKTVPLLPMQRFLEVDLVATAYQKCDSNQGLIKCNPKEKDDFCIANDFFRDNIMNCPPPYSTDEPQKSAGWTLHRVELFRYSCNHCHLICNFTLILQCFFFHFLKKVSY